MSEALRIAILAHSINPRGGVVHALELGDALCRLGHAATVHAPDAHGNGFFRASVCATVCVPGSPIVGQGVTAMVETRIADYVRHFEHEPNRRFDVWHAQDGISANALATLRKRGLISSFARTVHHVDTFEDAQLQALQHRGIVFADELFVVSDVWRRFLVRELDRHAHRVCNGVDTERFSPETDETDVALRQRLGLPSDAQIFLAIGGVEERKNTLRLLEAFRQVHAEHSRSRLVIAGGASLLDHDRYQRCFAQTLAQSGLPNGAVIITGPLPHELMPALYRAATTLAMPSVKEGFGLVVLEAMASGVPVVTSRIEPFTEYLAEGDVFWCDPFDASSIATALMASLDGGRRHDAITRGFQVGARHDWRTTALGHLPIYRCLREPAYA